MKNIICTVILMMSISTIGFNQNIEVKGVLIESESNKIIQNVIIKEKGTENIIISNEVGKFQLSISKNNPLIFTHLNFETKEVQLTDKNEVIIYLVRKSVELNLVIVKGNSLEDISHTIEVMDAIKKGSQIRNTAELFSDIPGFSLQKRSATAIEPSFRSFKYEEMNMKYDGGVKVVHACPNRMDPMTAHVIPEEVSKIEVIKGPYTVRYGQRFGPTVNIITKTPKVEDYGFHGKIETGYETNGNNLLSRAELVYATQVFDVTLNGETRKFDDYTDGKGTVVPSGFNTDSYSLKMGLNPTNKQRIHFDWRQKFGKDIKHAGLPMDSPMDDSWVASLDYKYTNISNKFKRLTFKTYTSYVDHLMDNKNRPSFKKKEIKTPVQSQTYGGKLELTFSPSEKSLLFVGLDADVIARQGTKEIIIKTNSVGIPLLSPIVKETNVWQNSIIQDYGIFIESSYKISKPLTASVGVRTDYVFSSIKTPELEFLTLYNNDVTDKTDVTIGANASLKYKKKTWRAQLAYGRGTRTPSMVERYIYRFSIGADPREYIGNPNLRPEINNQVELSVNKMFNKINVGASVYYSVFTDYITSRINTSFISTSPGGSALAPKQFWNVDARQYGFEANLKYEFYKNYSLTSDISYTIANNLSFNEPLAQVAPLATHFGIKWEPKKFWIDLRGEYIANQNRISLVYAETITPDYFVFDLRAGINPKENITLGGAVINILDEAYYTHLNFSFINSDINTGRIYEIGRSFSLFAKFKF